MLHSDWLEEKQREVGIVYAHIGYHKTVEVPVSADNDTIEFIRLPVRVALSQTSTEEWLKTKADDQLYGSVPRVGRTMDDPDTSQERTEANYKWMKANVRQRLVGINDVDQATGEEVWHALVAFDPDSGEVAHYDEATDTVYLSMQRLDESGAVTECSNALIGNTNYGAGVGQQRFRSFLLNTVGTDGGDVRQDA